MPWAVRRLSAALVHPTQRVQLFVNTFAPSNSLGTTAVCTEILEKKIEGYSGDCASLIEGT